MTPDEIKAAAADGTLVIDGGTVTVRDPATGSVDTFHLVRIKPKPKPKTVGQEIAHEWGDTRIVTLSELAARVDAAIQAERDGIEQAMRRSAWAYSANFVRDRRDKA